MSTPDPTEMGLNSGTSAAMEHNPISANQLIRADARRAGLETQ